MHHLQKEEWLSLLTVPSHCDIITDWLSQVTELPLLCGCWTGSCIAPSTVFSQPYGKNDHLGSFYGFQSKRLFRMNMMHRNTDNISHVPILTWPGRTSLLTSHGSVNDITQHFSLNSFLVLSFDTQLSHFKHGWKVLRENQFDRSLPFISINVSFGKTVSLKTLSWIFWHTNFIKNTITLDVSNGVNVRFVHRVL